MLADELAHAQAHRIAVRHDGKRNDRHGEDRNVQGFGIDELLVAAPCRQTGADDKHRDRGQQAPEEGLPPVAEGVLRVGGTPRAALADHEQRGTAAVGEPLGHLREHHRASGKQRDDQVTHDVEHVDNERNQQNAAG